jgi:hypothetical protein
MLSRMAAFRFVISEVLGSVAGFDSPVIAGPVVDASGGLKVGDWLDIDAAPGRIHVRCAGFPLLNWGRENWVSIAVSGLPPATDLPGLVSRTVLSGPKR